MGKARLYSTKKGYIPNAKADARYKKKFFEKGKAFADNDEERHQQRWRKAMVAECKKSKEAAE